MSNAYNPQDWGRHRAANGTHVRHSRSSYASPSGMSDSLTGMEAAMPSPPPAYVPVFTPGSINTSGYQPSPPAPQFSYSQRTSPTLFRSGYSPPLSSSPAAPFGFASNTPQQQTSPTLFPPPPTGQRDRSGSRARGVLNNLSAWASKNKATEASFPNSGVPLAQSVNRDSSSHRAATPPSRDNAVIIPLAPPATRRAVSVGYPGSALPQLRDSSTARASIMETTPWEPGMPIPPPPPGPPPGGRSQSLDRAKPGGVLPGQGSRTPPHLTRSVNTLGPIPPTPVGWSEENDLREYLSQRADRSDVQHSSEELAKLVHERDGSPKTLRERRTESRARSRDCSLEPSHSRGASVSRVTAKPADLVLSNESNLIVGRRRATRTSLSSRDALVSKLTEKDDSTDLFGPRLGHENVAKHGYGPPPSRFVLTPPFSPDTQTPERNPVFTQPRQTGEEAPNNISRLVVDSARNSPSGYVASRGIHSPLDNFQKDALERYRSLLVKEYSARSDVDKLKQFTDFMILEFRIRSKRYPEAFASTQEDLRQALDEVWNPSHPPTNATINISKDRSAGFVGDKSSSSFDIPEIGSGKYEPCLSPILSTALGKGPEDLDARGRPPSRWWEASTSSSSVGCIDSRKFERSRMESKYMSVSRDGQSAPHEQAQKSDSNFAKLSQPSSRPMVEGSAYIPEKAGWHEQQTSPRDELLQTPRPDKVDVSRLVNLPPPYPRRHPAVNNNHPVLSSFRTLLQNLRDRRFLDSQISPKQNGPCNDIAEGGRPIISRDQEITKRIRDATTYLDHLCNNLLQAVSSHDTTLTQEQGDEEPELLEKLTIAKRIFEAREQLHRDQIALYNNNASDPTTNNAKQNRALQRLPHARVAAIRHKHFQQTLQPIITAGIEAQLSAFWDIAPPLSEVLRKVPSDLHTFRIEIPEHEVAENPSYVEYPMQYFYTLLVHAQKSTYQFIDSQINLFCLLHEVELACASAECRLLESQWSTEGRGVMDIERGIGAMRKEADRRVTEELQERVRVVEELWGRGFGEEVVGVRECVEEYLRSEGGWSEALGEY